MSRISFRTDVALSAEAVIDVYRDSGLGERRPIDDLERMGRMVTNSSLVASAWDGGTLVGVARCLTDWSYVTYLADLAVRSEYQRRGIGRALVDACLSATDADCQMVVLAAPSAAQYYGRVGFRQHPSAWVLRRTSRS